MFNMITKNFLKSLKTPSIKRCGAANSYSSNTNFRQCAKQCQFQAMSKTIPECLNRSNANSNVIRKSKILTGCFAMEKLPQNYILRSHSHGKIICFHFNQFTIWITHVYLKTTNWQHMCLSQKPQPGLRLPTRKRQLVLLDCEKD